LKGPARLLRRTCLGRRPRASCTAGLAALLLVGVAVISCSNHPPRNIKDGCEIFSEKDDWYADAQDSYEKWGVPVHVQLAIIYQESRFVHDAQPPRTRLLWVIPWTRPSSAYGYGQIKDSTWDWYIKETGNRWADRDDFEDVVDFIGWYGDRSQRTLGIAKGDAYHQYLAYHEGHGGYRRKTYDQKPWLLKVARQVERRARSYQAQLQQCADSLDKGGWWPF
jgi:hypothetical protein